MRWLALLPLMFLFGCATYEYDIVRPERFAQYIGSKSDVVVDAEPLVYRLRSYENHLVMRIENPTEEPIQLLGTQSSVVDPKGQSHPLRSQTIAPGSFIKLILPPLKPQIERVGPSIGFGIGGRVSRDNGTATQELVVPASTEATPRYLDIYAEENTYYWDWDDQTDVRLLLNYQRDNKVFVDEFVFHRRKM